MLDSRGDLMRAMVTQRITAALGTLAVALLYFYGLNARDAYLSIEETQQALHAYTLSTSGRSSTGQWLPMYFSQPDFAPGRDPLWIYAAAAFLTVAPFSEGLVRAPSALAGVISVGLIFFVALRLFRSRALAVSAACLLALTPAHFIQSRIATSQIGPVLFELAWLLFLLRYLDTHRQRDLSLAIASLGVGIYTYLPALLMMPLYLGASLPLIDRRHRKLACTIFAAAFVPWIIWHSVHVERFQQLFAYYSANGYNAGERPLLTLSGLLSRGDYWWNAYNPGAMFLSGDSNIRFSTRNVGYFLIPTAGLLGLAFFHSLNAIRAEHRRLLLAALVLAPLPAVLAGDFEIKRWLGVVPFVILAATCGIAAVLTWPRRWAVPAVAVLVIISAVQFVRFLHDYHGDYRIRAIPWFGGNMRGAVVEVARTARDPRCVLLDVRLYPDYWPLYAAISGRADLASQTNVVDVARKDFAPPRECEETHLIVSEELVRENAAVRTNLAPPTWVSRQIPELGGQPYLTVFRSRSVAASELAPGAR